MTSREFSALCKRYGFSQQGKVYYRCFGEGILQLITIGNREYLDPLSPERTDKHRKSNRISFYFWSMYENLPETFFLIHSILREFIRNNCLIENAGLLLWVCNLNMILWIPMDSIIWILSERKKICFVLLLIMKR